MKRVYELPAVLVYRSTCPKCRWLSKIALIITFNQLRRIPLSSDEAQQIYAAFPGTKNKLAVFYRGKLYIGKKVIGGITHFFLRELVFERFRCIGLGRTIGNRNRS
jgi:hypothetical protein